MPVSPSMTASQLATFMASTKQKAAAVVDKRNGVIGVVSARDILTRVLAQNKDPSTYNVEKFMTKDPLVVTESEWSKGMSIRTVIVLWCGCREHYANDAGCRSRCSSAVDD